MKADDRRAAESVKTRAAILDATEAIMCEHGYAAVTSRRVGERAGLKSQLIHYHFGNMDELFMALFRRSEGEFFSKHLKSLSEASPLQALWEFSLDEQKMELALEFVAASNHLKPLRAELAQATEHARAIQNAIISKVFDELGDDTHGYTPQVLSFLIASVSRALVTEKVLGVSEGHKEVIDFMERLLQKFQPKNVGSSYRRVDSKPSPRRTKRNSAPGK